MRNLNLKITSIVTVYRATNDHFVLFDLRVKHHSEKLVMFELSNHIMSKQAYYHS